MARMAYKRNGFDGGTRFRFAADYYLFDDISWVSYYELGVNFPAMFDWIITMPTVPTTPRVVCCTPG